MKRFALLISLAGAIALVAAGAAGAHVLSVERASEKTFNYAEKVCGSRPRCEYFGVDRCRRRGEHQVRCRMHLLFAAKRGKTDCHRPVLWRLRRNELRRSFLSNSYTCKDGWGHHNTDGADNAG